VIIKIKLAVIGAALLLTGALAPQSAAAEGDPERGKALSYTCLGCHGIEGYRNAYPSYRVPKLGGQKAAYLAIALRGYRDGTRAHPTMIAQASSLSDQEIDDISAYLASIGSDSVAAGGTRGATLNEAASCAACHGENGISMSPTWPTLAGQHEDYLVKALTQYRDGTRTSAVMAPMAMALNDADIDLLARYFSRLSGLETTVAE
jgi:cytochrome c553